MKRIKPTPTQNQPDALISFAIEAVDAYENAYEVISDLSVIFEELKKHTMEDLGNVRILRMLSFAGFRYTADKLELIDAKISSANKKLDELRDADDAR